jgi:hypothetical protein
MDHSAAQSGPESSTMSGIREKRYKIGAKSQGSHKRATVRTVLPDVYFTNTQQTSHNPDPHPKAN